MTASLENYAAAAFIVYFLWLAIAPLLSPLRSISGPFLARFSRLWFLWRVWRGEFDKDIVALHQRYGSIVRLAPNHYCFNDPEAIKLIYGKGTEFDKSDWYGAWNPVGFKSLFGEPNVKAHGQLRRKFQSTYTMSSMISYETFAEQCIAVLCTRFEEIAKAGGVTNLSRWLLAYAGDAVSMITYAKRMGFLDAGQDVGDFFKTLHGNAKYSSLVGIFSELHPWIFSAMAWMSWVGLTKGTPRMFIARFTSDLIEEKREQRNSNEKNQTPLQDEDETAPKDFVSKFLDFHEQDSNRFTERDMNTGLVANIIAGSDTTAAALTAVFYCLLKHPAALEKLRDEVFKAREEGTLSSPPTFKEAYALPYLHAVIQEAMRVYAPIGLPLQRVVPPEGAHICGHFFPANTVVGVNISAIHRVPSIFGDDSKSFRPERWLDSDHDTLANMHRYWIPFGLGSRTCIGKNISLLEITKMVPEVISKFNFRLTGGLEKEGEEMKWFDMWFVQPVTLPVKVSIREE